MNVLIVGAHSYIGENFASYARAAGFARVDIVDSYDGWRVTEFAGYETVIFVAGIAHRKQTVQNKHLYFAVNRDLAVAVAEKSRMARVRQFVYLSSMAVYGKKEGEISEDTIPNPRHNDYYGRSKFEAEQLLEKLVTTDFAVTLVRPPMVYGANCPGKFAKLVKLARRLPVFPDSKNKRSIIYIDNLSEFLCTIVLHCARGIFCPKNNEYVSTAQLVEQIRHAIGKKTTIIGLSWLLIPATAICPPLKTAFGNLYYSVNAPSMPYNAIDLETSVKRSVSECNH